MSKDAFVPYESYIVLDTRGNLDSLERGLPCCEALSGCRAICNLHNTLSFNQIPENSFSFRLFFLGKHCIVSLSIVSCERNTFVGQGSVLKPIFANSFAFYTNKDVTQETLLQQSRRNIIKADLKIEFLCHYKG